MKNPLFTTLVCLITLTAASTSALAFPSACQSLQGKTLAIGCTRDCASTYQNALREAAAKLGVGVDISIVTSTEGLKHLDGFLSPGGHDIDPKYFSQNLSAAEAQKLRALHEELANLDSDGNKPSEEENQAYLARDKRESNLLKDYFAQPQFANLPFLGVCYGMQMLAASQGIPLYIDIERQLGIKARRSSNPDRHLEREKISLDPQSALLAFLPEGTTQISGYWSHHQAVDLSYIRANAGSLPNVKVTGTSNNGLIPEVIQLSNRHALGIQFHAEKITVDVDAHLAPYLWLLDGACRKVNQE